MKAYLIVDIPEEWMEKEVNVKVMDNYKSYTTYHCKIMPLRKKKKVKKPTNDPFKTLIGSNMIKRWKE